MAITVSGSADAEPAFLAIKAAAVASGLNAGGVSQIRVYDGALPLLTFNLNDPTEWTSAGAVWSANLTPPVVATVEAGVVNATADNWEIYDGSGAVAYTGSCTSSLLNTGDVVSITSWDVTEGN